jgi:hypothetical protein
MSTATFYNGLVTSGCLDILVNELSADKVIGVAIPAIGVIRNICVDMGLDAASRFASQGLASKLLTIVDSAEFALANIDPATDKVAKGVEFHWYAAKRVELLSLLTQVLSVLCSLCEASEKALDEFTNAQLQNNGKHIVFIMNHTLVTSDMSASQTQLVLDALQFLRAVTSNNDKLNNAVLANAAFCQHLTNLAETAAVQPNSAASYAHVLSTMRRSLSKELARKQGALASCLLVDLIPRHSIELASLASSVLVNLVQTHVESGNATNESLQQLALPALSATHKVLAAVDLVHEARELLTALEQVRAMISQVQQGNFEVDASAVAEETSIEGLPAGDQDQEEQGASDLPDFLTSQSATGTDLPVDAMWADAVSTHLRVFNQSVFALKNTMDTLTSAVAMLPGEDDEETPALAAQQTVLAMLQQFFVGDIPHYKLILDSQQEVTTGPFVPTTGDGVPAFFPAEIVEALSQLPMVAGPGIVHNINMLRVQALTSLSSFLLFIPEQALPAALADTLYASICALMASADVGYMASTPILTAQQQLLAAGALTAKCTGDQVLDVVQALSRCSVEEASLLAAALSHLVRRQEYKQLHEDAWAKITPSEAHLATSQQLPRCLAVSQGALRFLEAVGTHPVPATGSVGTPLGEAKLYTAMAVGCLGTSPLTAAVNKVFGSILINTLQSQGLMRFALFDFDLVYEAVNSLIDIYSEDDRVIEQYKEVGVTSKLAKFSTLYASYVRELGSAVKTKLKNKITSSEASTMELQIRHEKAMEASDNVKAFVQYKKKMGV